MNESTSFEIPASHHLLQAGGTAVLATALSSCGSGGGGDVPAVPAALTIRTVIIAPAGGGAVTVNGVTKATGGVTFSFDGGTAATSRPADPGVGGAPVTSQFDASATTGTASFSVTINPSVETAHTAAPAALKAVARGIAAVGFAPSANDLMRHAGLTQIQITDAMVTRLSGTPAEAYPAWIDDPVMTQLFAAFAPLRTEFQNWMLRQLITSPDPLAERLVLFWHNVFTTEVNNSQIIVPMARQHRTWRQNMVGNLGTFLKAMSRDPAMVIYLNSNQNKKGRPNENFARELLELFTLGENTEYGAYEETDIPVVARCFTGYSYNAQGAAVFNTRDHDFGPGSNLGDKFLWGESLPNTADDGDVVIDRILARKVVVNDALHSACGRYIVTRLWKEFIGDLLPGDLEVILALGDEFAAADGMNYELKPLYTALFRTAAFTDPARQGTRIRSPLEVLTGYFRALQITPTDATLGTIRSNAADLGQDLFNPETVFGAAGGTEWINVKTLVSRNAYLAALAEAYKSTVPASLVTVMDTLLLVLPPLVAPTESVDAGARAKQLVTDTAYHLR
jgi:uncharacterized protein (DUF1800 family)